MYELVIYDEEGNSVSYQISATSKEILVANDIIEKGDGDYYILHPGLSEPWRTIVKTILNLGNDETY